MAEAMVRAFLHKAVPGRLLKPRLLVSVPSGISEVAERAVVEAGLQAGARRVYLMEEPLAAALGAGIDIAQPEGHMVVDIGGGTTDVAVAALGGVVASTCLTTAGDQFDAALIQYVRERHQLLIGSRTAEGVKCAIGQVAGEGEATLAVKGRCLNTGLPREVTLSGKETEEALAPVARKIVAAVQGRAGAHPAGAGRRRGRERPAPHRGREPAAGDGHPPGPGDGDGHPPGRGPPPGSGPGAGGHPPPPGPPAGGGSSTWPGGGRWRDRAAAEAPPVGYGPCRPCH